MSAFILPFILLSRSEAFQGSLRISQAFIFYFPPLQILSIKIYHTCVYPVNVLCGFVTFQFHHAPISVCFKLKICHLSGRLFTQAIAPFSCIILVNLTLASVISGY